MSKRSLEEKRREALALKEAALRRSPEEKLKRLNARLGVGIGAVRERARLSKIINERKKTSKE